MAEAATLVREQYAHSMSTIRRLGEAAMGSGVSPAEHAALRELAYDDFESSIGEMLKTDNEFRLYLDINKSREHEVIDGKVRAKDGTSMVQILENGAAASRQAADEEPALCAQNIRDKCDVELAKRVDTLKPGETIWGLSLEPKKELQQHPRLYKALGYREGLSYLQAYSKVDDDTLIAYSYSIDMSDEQAWRAEFAARGIQVPEGISANTWLEHAHLQAIPPDEVEVFLRDVAKSYYNRVGSPHERVSVTDFVSVNRAILENFFDVYYAEAKSQALHTGKNNQLFKDLASTMQQAGLDKLKPEIQTQLSTLADSDEFNDQSARVLDSLVRYAVVEELRKGLPALIRHRQDTRNGDTPILFSASIPWQLLSPQQLHTMAAGNIHTGVAAGRSYGGCTETDLARRAQLKEDGSPQETYGGKGDANESDGKKKWMNCPFCPNKVYDDPCAKVLYCKHCTAKVVNGVLESKGKWAQISKQKAAQEKNTVFQNPNVSGNHEKMQLTVPSAEPMRPVEIVHRSRQAVGATAMQAPV